MKSQTQQKMGIFLRDTLESDFFIIAILILVSGASFGLGRMSISDANVSLSSDTSSVLQSEERSVEDNSILSQNSDIDISASGSVVASKNGTKYHFPWCSGAQRINEENKILFSSSVEARSNGFEPAKNCNGLK